MENEERFISCGKVRELKNFIRKSEKFWSVREFHERKKVGMYVV